MTIKTIKVASETGIIGLPPSSFVSDHMIKNSMPLAEIIPCEPIFESGMTLFKLNSTEGKKNYNKILKKHGFDIDFPIKVAFLADSFPTDSFTNEYGETFLEQIAETASKGFSELIQMTGSKTIGEATKKIGEITKTFGKEQGGIIGKALGTFGEAAKKGGAAIKGVESKHGLAGTISGLVAGRRVDFPQVWKGSAFSPSYTMTVRLYNPNPGNINATRKYIVGPLAVLLCLVLPRSQDGSTYNWPFFHKVKSRGIYELNPAVITNISVIKGGDQQQISYQQHLGIVDVRIDFSSLFSSILIEEGDSQMTNRPTLRSYLESIEDKKNLEVASGAPVSYLSSLELARSRKISSAQSVTQREKTVNTRVNSIDIIETVYGWVKGFTT